MNAQRKHLPAGPYVVALVTIVAVAVISFFAFHPSLPFVHGYRVEAVFHSSNGLRSGSPVRIEGIDVGKVSGLKEGPGDTTIVTMDVKDNGRPIHRDATARIRPRVFLEGGFYVDLSPGSPSAKELASEGTIPLAQTTTPVQFHQFLSAFDEPARKNLRNSLHTLAGALDDGGAEGLKTLAPQLKPLLRDVAWVSQAVRGSEKGDLVGLIRSTNRVATALDTNRETVGELTENLASVTRTIAERDTQLEDTISSVDRLVRAAPPAMRALNASLPSVERASREVLPGTKIAASSFRATTKVMNDLGALVAPARREKTVDALRTALVGLPTMVTTLGDVLPAAKGVSDCLASHVVPLFDAKVPDGDLSTNRPVWQDFAHALVGLSSASSEFDGNGHSLRYQLGIGPSTLSVSSVPLLGTLLSSAPSSLQSRPLPSSVGGEPPFRTDVDCATQPQPSLEAESGSAGLEATSSTPTTTSLSDLLKLIGSPALRSELEKTR